MVNHTIRPETGLCCCPAGNVPQRGVYQQPSDPDGQHLVVKASLTAPRGGIARHAPNASRHQHTKSSSPAAAQAEGAHGSSEGHGSGTVSGVPGREMSRKLHLKVHSASLDGQEVDMVQGGCSTHDHELEQKELAGEASSAAGPSAAGMDSTALGGRNRQRVLSRQQQAAVAAGITQPGTPKVVLNRKGVTGSVGAPWMQ